MTTINKTKDPIDALLTSEEIDGIIKEVTKGPCFIEIKHALIVCFSISFATSFILGLIL